VRIAAAIAVSLFAHAALAFGVFYLRGRPEAEKSVEMQAPLGAVFVQVGRETGPGGAPVSAPPPEPAAADEAPEVPAAPESGGGPRAGSPDGEAHPVGEIHPDYPAMSRKLGEEGEAAFDVDVATDGTVADARLTKSTGHERLDEAARAAIVGARYRAAVKNGEPVTSTTKLRIEFRLTH
jgi:protein TonB